MEIYDTVLFDIRSWKVMLLFLQAWLSFFSFACSHVKFVFFFLYSAIKWDEEIGILDINYDDEKDTK